MNLKFSESDENHYLEPRRPAIDGAQCPKLQFHGIQENSFKVCWINRAIDNLGNVIAMTDDEALDFFRRVKSTYAIFEVPMGETVRQFFMHFTNNWELKSIKMMSLINRFLESQ
jgi:hypothetical protein